MKQRVLALLLLGLVAIAFGLHQGPRLAASALSHTDEVLAGERAREILVRGDPSRVTLNFEANHRKPPLQYWLVATLLKLTDQPESAVRLPALLYSCATIFLAGLLAGRLVPRHPFVMPLCGLLLAGNLAFALYAGLGLLEPGQSFFLLLTLLGLSARNAPLAGLACALGAWQKLPVGYVLWAIFVLADRLRPPAERPHVRGQAAALATSLIVAAAWPALQMARDASGYLGAHVSEVAKLAGPPEHALSAWWRYLQGLWMSGWMIPLGAAAGLALVVASPRVRKVRGLAEAAVFALLWLAAISASEIKHPHYLLTVLPLLAVLAVAPLVILLEGQPRRRTVLVSVLAGYAFYFAATHQPPRYYDLSEQREVTEAFAAALRPGEQPVLVRFADDTPYPQTISAEFMLFYGRLTRPAITLAPRDAAAALREGQPLRGLAGRASFAEIAAEAPARAVQSSPHFVHWAWRP